MQFAQQVRDPGEAARLSFPLAGAFSRLVRFDVMRTAAHLRELAGECRRLAAEADERTAANLIMLAEEYEAQAERQEGERTASRPGPAQRE